MYTMLYISLGIMLVIAAIGAASVLSEFVDILADDERRND